MQNVGTLQLTFMRSRFVLLALSILFFHLLPLETAPRAWAPPDLLMCFAFAWSVRRPEYVPALLLGAVFLLADLMLQRPPGLWAALMVIACQRLKVRAHRLRAATFMAEMTRVAALVAAVGLLNNLALSLFLVETTRFGLSMMQIFLTILVYPAVVLVTHSLLRVQKIAPGDLDGPGVRP